MSVLLLSNYLFRLGATTLFGLLDRIGSGANFVFAASQQLMTNDQLFKVYILNVGK